MSEYEFWDELGNIFNAIVAYQHKTVEFNKRFVNPWLRLGTVLDQEDRNSDALIAAKKSIEIDEDNATNWLSLGDVYFKMGSFDDAACAYGKAIELNPKLGWAYANLALTNSTRQKYTDAVNLYIKSLELIDDNKDRAMIWNRLGNVYRKVNDYENAFIAFQMADECDGQNTGFHDQLDEVTPEQRVMPIFAEVYVNNNSHLIATVDEPRGDVIKENDTQPEETEDGPVDEAVSQTLQSELSNELTVDETVNEAVESETEEETSYQEAFVHAVQSNAENEATPEVTDANMTPSDALEEGSVDEALTEPEQSGVEDISITNAIGDGEQSMAVQEESGEDTVVEVVQSGVADVSNSGEVVSEDLQPETTGEGSLDRPTDDDKQAGMDEGGIHEETTPEVVELDAVEESLVDETVSGTMQREITDDSISEETDSESAQPEGVTEDPTDVPAASDEITAETVESKVEEIVSVDETVKDASQSEAVEEAQPESVEENPDESPVAVIEQSEVESEAPLENTMVDETQAAIDVEAQLHVVDKINADNSIAEEDEHVDSSPDTTIAYIESKGAETLGDPSSLKQPVILVVDDLNELVNRAGPDLDVESDTSSSNVLETQSQTEEVEKFETEAVIDEQSKTDQADGDVAENVPESNSLAMPENEAAKTDKEVQLNTHQVGDSSLIAETTNPNSDDENNQLLDYDNEPAYEEFLKNGVEPVAMSNEGPVKKDLKVEPDTKNAHVWNELGNVYFNTGAFEEAVTAYSKAIELDDWFAWPYSNLALVYVQKEMYAEAILLYQRSIELFSSDKDKAITWNRLGNVYRRLADYDYAIECYQNADELDPNNATRSLRSRFSLLGNLNVEQTESIVG